MIFVLLYFPLLKELYNPHDFHIIAAVYYYCLLHMETVFWVAKMVQLTCKALNYSMTMINPNDKFNSKFFFFMKSELELSGY